MALIFDVESEGGFGNVNHRRPVNKNNPRNERIDMNTIRNITTFDGFFLF